MSLKLYFGHHPVSDPPSCSALESSSLVVDKSAVSVTQYLKGISRGTSPGVLLSIFVMQSVAIPPRLLKICLHTLTCLMDFFLSGKASFLLEPYAFPFDSSSLKGGREMGAS